MNCRTLLFLSCLPFAHLHSSEFPADSSLEWEKLVPPFGEEVDGEVLRGSLDGKVRRVKLTVSVGDYGEGSHTVFFNESGNVERIVYEDSHPEIDPENTEKTVKLVLERDFLFEMGKLTYATEKAYSGEDDQQLAIANRRVAPKEIEPNEQSTKRLVEPAKEMLTAKAPRFVVIAEELQRAQDRLQELPISDDLEDWAPVNIPVGRHASDLTAAPENVAFNLLMKFGFVEEGGEAQQVYSDILESKPGEFASVVVTIDNPGDDEIAAVRYLIEIGNNLETWQLMGIGRQIKRWEDRGGKGWEKK